MPRLRTLLPIPPTLAEIQASNGGTMTDEDGKIMQDLHKEGLSDGMIALRFDTTLEDVASVLQ